MPWNERINKLDFAFQPIINRDFKLVGVEALLRMYKEAGFTSINEVFDNAYKDEFLYSLDLKLREKVISKYEPIYRYSKAKLYYNIDNRLLDMPNFSIGNTRSILSKKKIPKSALCFEISERHKVYDKLSLRKILDIYRSQGYTIALDDFGSGYSNLEKLYYLDPGILKVDRFLIQDIHLDKRKQSIVKYLIPTIKELGSLVLAEGIESKEEFDTCIDLGFDLFQGYYIGRPTLNTNNIKHMYIFK